MKRLFLITPLLLLLFSFTSIPERIEKWILEYHKEYEALDIGITIPDYPDKSITQICKDSFLISPQTVLKVQCLALQNEQVRYGYSWEGVGVAYGMMPGAGNYWEDISVGRGELLPEVKKYLFAKMIKNRGAQSQLYHWAKPAIIAAWTAKPDTAQAMDLFAIWKCQQYLAQYTIQKEKIRENVQKELTDNYNGEEYKYTVGFTSLDWKGRQDHDAKLYCFWHRRIKEYAQTGNGFSVDDARFWMNVAYNDMWSNAKPATKEIFEAWKAAWLKQ